MDSSAIISARKLTSKSLQLRLLGHCIICLRKVKVKRNGSRIGASEYPRNDGDNDENVREMAPKSVVTSPGFLATFNQLWTVLQSKLKKMNGNGSSEEGTGISLENVLQNGPVSNVIFSRAPTVCEVCCDKIVAVESLMKAVRQQVGELNILLEEGRRRQEGGLGDFEKSLRENELGESVIQATLQFVGIFTSSHFSGDDFPDGQESIAEEPLNVPPVSSTLDLAVDKENSLTNNHVERDDENEGQVLGSGNEDDDKEEDPDYIKSESEEDEDDDNQSEDEMEVDTESAKNDSDFQVEKDPLAVGPNNLEDRAENGKIKWKNQFGSGEKEAPGSDRIACTCGRTFLSRKTQRDHMRRNRKLHPEYEPFKGTILTGNRQMCEFCGEWLMSRDVLSHLTDHLNGKAEWVVKCPNEKCRYLFASSNALHSHTRNSCHKECTRIWKEKFGPVCEICGFKGINLLTIKNHVRDKHENDKEKKWECPISNCGKMFSVRQSVHHHLYEHRSRKITEQICDKCGESLKVEEMEGHLKDKHGILEVIGCKQCELKFSGREEMIEHLFEHRGTGILCDICGDKQEKFLNKYSDFREHYLMVHKLFPKKYKCGEKDCDKWFWRNVDKEDHQMRIHEGNDRNKRHRGNTTKKGINGKNFECDICNVKFWRGVTLITHNIRVHGAEPFKCDSCGETFDDKFKFNKHRKEHGGIVFQKEWKCEVEGCGKIFKSKKFWKRHQEVSHGGERKHVCEICGKSYCDAGRLKTHHDSVHLGLRPYVCEECGESFTTSTTLKTHKLIHTGERNFGCELCGQRFRQKGVLARHVKGHEEKGAEFKPNGPMKQIRKRKNQ